MVLSHLKFKRLARVGAVDRRWSALAREPRLWKAHAAARGGKFVHPLGCPLADEHAPSCSGRRGSRKRKGTQGGSSTRKRAAREEEPLLALRSHGDAWRPDGSAKTSVRWCAVHGAWFGRKNFCRDHGAAVAEHRPLTAASAARARGSAEEAPRVAARPSAPPEAPHRSYAQFTPTPPSHVCDHRALFRRCLEAHRWTRDGRLRWSAKEMFGRRKLSPPTYLPCPCCTCASSELLHGEQALRTHLRTAHGMPLREATRWAAAAAVARPPPSTADEHG